MFANAQDSKQTMTLEDDAAGVRKRQKASPMEK